MTANEQRQLSGAMPLAPRDSLADGDPRQRIAMEVDRWIRFTDDLSDLLRAYDEAQAERSRILAECESLRARADAAERAAALAAVHERAALDAQRHAAELEERLRQRDTATSVAETAQTTELVARVKQLEGRVVEREQEIAARDATIAANEVALHDLRIALTQLAFNEGAAPAELDAELQAAIEELEHAVRAQRRTLEERDARVAAMEAEIQRLKGLSARRE